MHRFQQEICLTSPASAACGGSTAVAAGFAEPRARVARLVAAVGVGRVCGVLLLTAAAILMICTSGCQRSPFPQNADRTQFQRYDTMRNRYVPLEVPDVFGNPQPALRERLSQSGT